MKKKILVIENNEAISDAINHILTDEGYEVKLSLTDVDMFNKILLYKPDAILLDIIHPTVEGTELCRNLKAAETTKHIPVIVLSTHNKATSIKEVCADEVILKPFDVDFLINMVEKHLMQSYN